MTELKKKRKFCTSSVQVAASDVSDISPTDNATARDASKNKRNRFSYQQKQEILQECKHLTSNVICEKYDVSERSLRRWKIQKDEILEASSMESLKNAKKTCATLELDNKLYSWFLNALQRGIPISGPILRQQAIIINRESGGSTDFQASTGWFEKWKKRKSVKNLKITGEKLSANENLAKIFLDDFAKTVKMQKLDRAQVFNMDESGLQYKMTPKRSVVPKDQAQVSGPKKQMERITIASCCNADGSLKLPLIVIGKSKNPHCLRNVNKDDLPVWYRGQKSAWMDLLIYEEWFTKEFVPKVEAFLISKNLSMKAILLVDNCRAHKYLKINNIEIYFFPPNVTSLIQPMDQGIIQTLKLHYEINLVNAILNAQEDNVPLLDYLKTVYVYKAIFWIAEAWNKIKPETIWLCWKPLWPIETRDVAIQTDELLYVIDCNLGASQGIEMGFETAPQETHNVNDLLSILRKVKGYELIDAATVLNWIKKSENDNFLDNNLNNSNNSENDIPLSPLEEVGSLSEFRENEVSQFNYLSTTAKILYEM